MKKIIVILTLLFLFLVYRLAIEYQNALDNNLFSTYAQNLKTKTVDTVEYSSVAKCNTLMDTNEGVTDLTITMIYIEDVVVEIQQIAINYGVRIDEELIYIFEKSKDTFGEDYVYYYKSLENGSDSLFIYYEKINLRKPETVDSFLEMLEANKNDYLNGKGLLDFGKWIGQFSEYPDFKCDYNDEIL